MRIPCAMADLRHHARPQARWAAVSFASASARPIMLAACGCGRLASARLCAGALMRASAIPLCDTQYPTVSLYQHKRSIDTSADCARLRVEEPMAHYLTFEDLGATFDPDWLDEDETVSALPGERVSCAMCGCEEFTFLGMLGSMAHWRCRACGMDLHAPRA